MAVMCDIKKHHITANFDELCLLTLHACAPAIAATSNGKESCSHTYTLMQMLPSPYPAALHLLDFSLLRLTIFCYVLIQ